jgi:hypothetical protein
MHVGPIFVQLSFLLPLTTYILLLGPGPRSPQAPFIYINIFIERPPAPLFRTHLVLHVASFVFLVDNELLPVLRDAARNQVLW